MKHISLGGLEVSRIGLGAMSMSGYYNIGAGSDTESIRTMSNTEVTGPPVTEYVGSYSSLVVTALSIHAD